MSAWWQNLDTGEIHEVADHATARRLAIECLHAGGRPYVSNTQIPPGHGKTRGVIPRVNAVWEVDDPVEEIWTA